MKIAHLAGTLLMLAPSLSCCPQEEISPPGEINLSHRQPFVPTKGVDPRQFRALLRITEKINASARRQLLEAGRKSVPAILNTMLALDYSDLVDEQIGRKCNAVLGQIIRQSSKWQDAVDSKSQQVNKRTVLYWCQIWDLCKDDEAQWWKSLGLEPGLLLAACQDLSLPDTVKLALFDFQSAIDIERRVCLHALERRTADLRQQAQDASLRARSKLLSGLGASLERLRASDVSAAANRLAVLIKRLDSGGAIPWPIGKRASLKNKRRKVSRAKREIVFGKHSVSVDVHRFDGIDYAVIPWHTTWWDADRVCETNGGHLACLDSREKLGFVASILPTGLNQDATDRYSIGPGNTTATFWVGATDRAIEQTWNWANGKKIANGMWQRPALPGGSGNNFPQPNNGFGSDHWAGLALYTDQGKLDPVGGLADYYGGWPSRFVCAWGVEPAVGIWGQMQSDYAAKSFDEYFGSLLDSDDKIARQYKRLHRELDKPRKSYRKILRTQKEALVKTLAKELRQQVQADQHLPAAAIQRLLWILQDKAAFVDPAVPKPSGPGPAARHFLGKAYEFVPTPTTHDEAEKLCRARGGQLVTFEAAARVGDLVGVGGPTTSATRTDPEVAFLRAMLRDAGVARVWVGYRRRGWVDALRTSPWYGLAPSGDPVPSWLEEELGGSPDTYKYGQNSWAKGHGLGVVLESSVATTAAVGVRHVATRGQQKFALPFTPVPAAMIRLRIDGKPVSAFHVTGPDKAKKDSTAEVELAVSHAPVRAGATVFVYASPLTSALISERLPYVCVWNE